MRLSAAGHVHQGEPPTPPDVDLSPKKESFTQLVNTHYGQMLIPRHDLSQSPALQSSGYALDHRTIVKLSYTLSMRENPVFLDIGANIGAFSFALQPLCSKVYAFEPQRIIYNMLCGSIALNGWQNVYAFCAAIGNEETMIPVPKYDYNKPMSFGSIEFTPTQVEKLHQERQPSTELVDMYRLDVLDFDRIDLMKIDVEGFEMEVLKGGMETIKKHHPIMFIEHGKCDRSLKQAILDLDYYIEELPNDYLCTPRN